MKYILGFLFIALFTASFAQTAPPSQALISVGMTSPEAASLGKFGNIPVSYSTGIPNITIPIYEIKIGEINLPISLDYHAGGIRVDEISSSVGTGWALNAGGEVSRAMIGYPDELSNGYLAAPAPADLYANPDNYLTYIYNNTYGYNDVSPDVFSYNVQGISGKFMIKHADGSFLQFPQTNNRIENYNGNNYKITDPNGIAYIFEQHESTSMGPVNGVSLLPTYTSTWRLTKIVSSNLADTVFINYDIAHTFTYTKSFSHTIGTQPSCDVPGNTELNSDSFTSQAINTDETYPSSITWRGGKIAFTNLTGRTDNSNAKRLGEIDVYANTNGTMNLVKQAKLVQSYFYYAPPGYTPPQDVGNQSFYRLRLDSVQFADPKNSLSPQSYSMTYDNTPMAPRESYGQDVWGFNNGHFENTSLMPTQTVTFDPDQVGAVSYFTFGSANRASDVNYIKACSLQSMTYPTGGKTVYALEPHQYATGTNQIIAESTSCSAQGNFESSNTQTFTVTSAMANLRYNASITSFNYSDVSDRPKIVITDQATNQAVLTINGATDASQSVSIPTTTLNPNIGGPILVVGHTYTITVNIYTTDQNVNAGINILYDVQTDTPVILSGGGLRVKSITNYDNTGSFIDSKSYTYNSDGTGTLLTPYNYFAITSKHTTFRRGCPQPDGQGGGGCLYVTAKPSVIYYASTVVPISQFTGSPVIYGGVTEYETSASGGNTNGKKVFGYTVVQDQQVLANNDYSISGVQMVSNVWQNGYLKEEDTYKSTSPTAYALIESKIHNYGFLRQNTEPAVRIAPVFSQMVDGNSCQIQNATTLTGDILLDSYTIPYSAILLLNDTLTTIPDNGTAIKVVKNYYYDNPLNILTTRLQSFNNQVDTLLDVIKYPQDMAVSGNVYQTMASRNRIAPVVSYQELNDGVQQTLTNVNYNDWFGNGSLLQPQSVSEQVLTHTAETRVNYNKYDIYGNILQQQKANAPYASYQWGYNQQYPVAMVKNAKVNDIFYDSFEEGDGNSLAGESKTGHYCYNGTATAYSKTLTGLDTGTYTLSYWKKTGSAWSWVTNSAVHVTSGTYPLTIPAGYEIDDIRFYPSVGQMRTYTYDPLIGITSSTDEKGEITYYEYDNFLRLKNIRDKDGSILKNYCYNYAGQATGCPVIPIGVTSGSASVGSFVTSDLMDNEWKQEAPAGYTIAGDDGTTINAAGNSGANAGRFVYFSTGGTTSPVTYINGNLSFTAKGSGTIEVQLIATYDNSIQARKTFTLTSGFQTFNWALTNLYPQLEMVLAVVVNGGNSSSQASVQFQKNFSLNLNQLGFTGTYTRYRADSTSLIGNVEKGWYGWNDQYNAPRKKYLQHSAYARMRLQTSANRIAIEYVRDFYDKRVVNLFSVNQTQNSEDFDNTGNVVAGGSAINTYTQVTGGQTYTISGLLTTNPTYVWYNNSTPLAAPAGMTNQGTSLAPVYQLTAPANATNLALLVQRSADYYLVYTNCMVQQGAIGTVTPLDGTIPSAFSAFTGYVPSHISGPAIFINGSLYKYYQVEGTDVAKVVQFVTDTLPAGNKTVEVMMPGQGTYLPADPHVRRSGTYLRAVYLAGTGATVQSPAVVKPGSIVYIHDSILSGYNISSDAQNNVWMMKTLRDPTFGFTGDIFSEGYAGRILYTDVSTPALTTAFAQKLASFGVDKYWFQIGVNDFGFDTPLPAFYTQFKSLIEQLKALRPNAKFYIQSTGPESYEGPNNETIADDGINSTGPSANDFRDVQRALATSHAYAEYVNFEGLFSPVIANTADGIHPTDAGNLLYANGIKNNSTLLGTAQAQTALAFYRNSTRHLVQSVSGIYTITATGGKAPYTFSKQSGSLPPGLIFNADGTIIGTPLASGSGTISVKVTDAASATMTQNFTLTVDSVPVIVVGPSQLINAQQSMPYSQTVKGHYGYGPYTFTVITGALPSGITLNSATGVLSGTPASTGTATFTITARDHWGFTGSTAYSLTTGTGTPPPLTDNFTVTATVDANNHLILTGHLHDFYSQTLFTYFAAYFTPSGGSEVYLNGGNVNVAAGLTSGQPVDMGAMALNPGSFSVRLVCGGVSPATLDGVNITYDATITQSLSTSVTSPTEQMTVTATITPAGHLMVTASIPNVTSNTIYTSMGAGVVQPGYSDYISGPAINIGAGTNTSGPVDFGLLSASQGSVNITIYIGGISPNSADGYFIGYPSSTQFNLTMPPPIH